jgi:very-short-patch-repair endonuclease
MSRFPGWNSQAIVKLELKQSGSDAIVAKALKEKRARQRKLLKAGVNHSPQLNNALISALNGKSFNADKIAHALCALNIPHKREYQFDSKRKFRFDFAFPDHKLAVEYEGGVYGGKGRHTRQAGYARDAQKYNLAVKQGWKLLRYTAIDAEVKNWEFKVVLEIQKEMEKFDEKEKN